MDLVNCWTGVFTRTSMHAFLSFAKENWQATNEINASETSIVVYSNAGFTLKEDLIKIYFRVLLDP